MPRTHARLGKMLLSWGRNIYYIDSKLVLPERNALLV
jgi:hypothetical protein